MIVNSNFSKQIILNNYGINSHVSYLGVDNRLFKPMNVLKENFVLSVGQWIPEKGFEFILKSLVKINYDLRPAFVISHRSGKYSLEKLS